MILYIMHIIYDHSVDWYSVGHDHSVDVEGWGDSVIFKEEISKRNLADEGDGEMQCQNYNKKLKIF